MKGIKQHNWRLSRNFIRFYYFKLNKELVKKRKAIFRSDLGSAFPSFYLA